jgi:hypothetical protein
MLENAKVPKKFKEQEEHIRFDAKVFQKKYEVIRRNRSSTSSQSGMSRHTCPYKRARDVRPRTR